ncbi:MAG: 50S ribosomal protein L23 [Candidatus Amulumruptor caecigallinarius]|nr:50S ribosomal protein L23 [Candidatus Amulumruptor caecigallinarius]MCM1396552.1 50S ribosomal protein L23 [Candidatus Amulumruptor caecigallinarius]MCM1453390.1 50S ribosomal protein L23 [bacterium]
MDIQITPIVTEKATRLQEKLNRYTFRVSPEANKFQIKDLVEKIYGVKVEAVNTMEVRGKNRSRWTRSGLLRGKTAAYKKAIITVADGQSIDFYSNI